MKATAGFPPILSFLGFSANYRETKGLPVLPPLRPGALDDLLERYINNEHPLSRQMRNSRKSALHVIEARLAWTAGSLPGTPAEVILRQCADEETMRLHPVLNSPGMLWEFRRHRLSLFALHLQRSWRELYGHSRDWRREAFEGGDWSRLGDSVRVLSRAAQASVCLTLTAAWTIGLGRQLPLEARIVQRWSGRLIFTRLRIASRAA